MSAPIEIPIRLGRPNRFVKGTRDSATGLKPADDGRLKIGPEPGLFHLVVTRDQLRHAVLLCQAICTEAERRGWEIRRHTEPGYAERPGVAIGIRAHSYPVEVHEVTETLAFTDDEIAVWRAKPDWETRGRRRPPPQHKRRRAIGRLRLHLPNGYQGGRVNWTEGRLGSFETRLVDVFETLEQRAVEDDRRAIEAEKAADKWRREQATREARARRQKIDQARSARLIAEADAWHRSARIRAYVAALRQRLEDLPDEEHSRLALWCAWAEDLADRSDPVASTELIVGFDDESDEFGYRRVP